MRAPVLRFAVAALALVAGVWLALPSDEATAGIPAQLLVPPNDGGVTMAFPSKYASSLVGCSGDQKAVIVQNPDDSDLNPSSYAVRVGSSRVSCKTGKKNGVRVKAGQSFTWTLAGGALYVCSEDPADAGAIPLGVVCAYGGPP